MTTAVLAYVPVRPDHALSVDQAASLFLPDATLTHGHNASQVDTWTNELADPPVNLPSRSAIFVGVGSWLASNSAAASTARLQLALAAADWAVGLPPSAGNLNTATPCVPFNQAREPIAIWMTLEATHAKVKGIQDLGGGGRSYLAAPGPQITGAGYLLAQVMTRLPVDRVTQILDRNWTTWTDPHTTDAQLATTLGIPLPAVPTLNPTRTRHTSQSSTPGHPYPAELHHMTVAAVVGAEPATHPGPAESRPRRTHARPAVLVARHAILTTPWATLTAGCVTGTAVLAVLAYFAGTSHTPLDQTTVRLTLLPAVAALTFVPHTPLRPLAQTTPLPTSIPSSTQVVLAIPVLVVTSWVQLVIMAHTHPTITRHHLAAIDPLIAQLTGWAAIALAVAAGCDRSRYADLTGAIAAPITLAVIAFCWLTPGVKDLLVSGRATPPTATIAWYSIAAVSLAIAVAALRDTWHRYTRRRR